MSIATVNHQKRFIELDINTYIKTVERTLKILEIKRYEIRVNGVFPLLLPKQFKQAIFLLKQANYIQKIINGHKSHKLKFDDFFREGYFLIKRCYEFSILPV